MYVYLRDLYYVEFYVAETNTNMPILGHPAMTLILGDWKQSLLRNINYNTEHRYYSNAYNVNPVYETRTPCYARF